MKIVGVIVSVILVLVIVVSIGFIGIRSLSYINDQNFGFGEALKWAWEDYINKIHGIFTQTTAENESFMWYDKINEHIKYEGFAG